MRWANEDQMPRCEVCGIRFKAWQPDDHLDSSNWNLPDQRTADVCSDACREVLVDGYNLAQKKRSRLERARTIRMKSALDRVRNVLAGYIPISADSQQVEDVYYAIRSTLDIRDDDDD